MNEELSFRIMREEDLAQVLELWERESGWGPLDADTWRSWFQETPHGAAVVSVAVDARSRIVGQEVFSPSRVVVDSELYPALRLSAPILDSDLRTASLKDPNHPVIGLFRAAAQEAMVQRFALIYALPARGWLPFFRWGAQAGLEQFATEEFDCWERSIDHQAGASQAGSYRVSRLARFEAEHDQLWAETKKSFPIHCAVERSAEYLQFRNNRHICLNVHACDDDSLIGFCALKKQDGLLVELVVRHPDEFKPVLTAVMAHVGQGSDPDVAELQSIKSIVSPVFEPNLRELGFEQNGFRFGFACISLSRGLDRNRISPEQWYLLPGD